MSAAWRSDRQCASRRPASRVGARSANAQQTLSRRRGRRGGLHALGLGGATAACWARRARERESSGQNYNQNIDNDNNLMTSAALAHRTRAQSCCTAPSSRRVCGPVGRAMDMELWIWRLLGGQPPEHALGVLDGFVGCWYEPGNSSVGWTCSLAEVNDRGRRHVPQPGHCSAASRCAHVDRAGPSSDQHRPSPSFWEPTLPTPRLGTIVLGDLDSYKLKVGTTEPTSAIFPHNFRARRCRPPPGTCRAAFSMGSTQSACSVSSASASKAL